MALFWLVELRQSSLPLTWLPLRNRPGFPLVAWHPCVKEVRVCVCGELAVTHGTGSTFFPQLSVTFLPSYPAVPLSVCLSVWLLVSLTHVFFRNTSLLSPMSLSPSVVVMAVALWKGGTNCLGTQKDSVLLLVLPSFCSSFYSSFYSSFCLSLHCSSNFPMYMFYFVQNPVSFLFLSL